MANINIPHGQGGPGGWQGLLNSGMLGDLGQGLLSVSGYSTTPTTIGQGLGLGLQAHQRNKRARTQEEIARQQMTLAETQARIVQEKAAAEARARQIAAERAAARDAAIPGLLAKLPEGMREKAAAVFAADPVAGMKMITSALSDGPGGMFEGTGMDAQAMNQHMAAEMRAWKAANPNATPEQESSARQTLAANLSRWHLTQPRGSGVDPITGQVMTVSPPPLPLLGGAPQRGAGLLPAPSSGGAPPRVSESAPPAATRGKPGQRLSDADRQSQGLGAGVYVYDRNGIPKKVGEAATLTEGEERRFGQGEIALKDIETVENSINSGAVDPTDFLRASAAATPAVAGVFEAVGAGVSEDEARVASAIESLGNTVLAMVRGAQVGPQEQAKFEKQLPRLGQNKALFQANLAATKRNIQFLQEALAEKGGRKAGGLLSGEPTPVISDPEKATTSDLLRMLRGN